MSCSFGTDEVVTSIVSWTILAVFVLTLPVTCDLCLRILSWLEGCWYANTYIYIYTYWIDDPRTNTDTAAAFTMTTGGSGSVVRRPLITWLASFLITSSLIFLVLLSPLFWFTHRVFLDIPLLYVPQVHYRTRITLQKVEMISQS